jgi:hypothetical protein
MSPLDLLNHLFNLLAPAAGMALVLALLGPWLAGRGAPRSRWSLAGIDFVVGSLVLIAGLLVHGRDGKMSTYAALVVVMASSHWLQLRGWRR